MKPSLSIELDVQDTSKCKKELKKTKEKLRETKRLLMKKAVEKNETRKLLYKAQEIITRMRNKTPRIYNCECGEMNGFAIKLFFRQIVTLNNKYKRSNK